MPSTAPAPTARAAAPAQGSTARATRRGGTVVVVAAVTVWAGALTVSTAAGGLPLARDRLLLWVAGLVVAVGLDRPRRLLRALFLEWLPLFAILLGYDVLRGRADGLERRAHVEPQQGFDELVFGRVPTLWLQDRLWDGDPRWFDVLAWVVYVSHFVVPLAVAVVLWRRSEAAFRRYVAALLTLTLAAFLTYAAYPAVPPWLASKRGDLEATDRLIGITFRSLGFGSAESYLPLGEKLSNPVAALPSLHSAVPFLLLLLSWPALRGARAWWRRTARALLAAYPLAMGAVLVYGAEHYVFDVLLGWGYAVAVVLGLRALTTRWARRGTGLACAT